MVIEPAAGVRLGRAEPRFAPRRTVSVVLATSLLVGVGLAGCAAGRIEPLTKPVSSVSVGLNPEQVDLRIAAKAAQRSPWGQVSTAASSFSLSSVFAVLVDGLGAVDAQPVADGAAGAQADDPRAALSDDAQAYLAQIESRILAPGMRMAALEDDLADRIGLTRRVLAAASRVLAAHQVAAPLSGGAARESARDDMALINDALEALGDQRTIFAEVVGHVMAHGEVSGLAIRALSVWGQDIEALDRLRDTVGEVIVS